MKITSIIKDLNETVGYVLSDNNNQKKVTVQELVRVNPKLDNANIQNQQVKVYNSELLPVIQINKTIFELDGMNKRLAVLTGIAEPFRYTIINKEIDLLRVSTELRGKFEIPQGVTIIGYTAFNGCSSLTSIVLPEKLTKIAMYAFYNCSSLTSIIIPDSVVEIGDWGFKMCSSLRSISIPKYTKIGEGAFEDCPRLNITKR